MSVITKRRDALAAGLKTYISGKACPQGHISERFTDSGGCIECAKRREKERSAAGYYNRRYEDENTGVRAKIRTRYEANREKIMQYVRGWCRDNPEARRAIASSYKHRRRSQEAEGMSGTDLARWTKAQKKICYWCGERCGKDYHVDHYEPLSKGGLHAESNLVIACADCNRRKSARDPYQFAIQRGRLF